MHIEKVLHMFAANCKCATAVQKKSMENTLNA